MEHEYERIKQILPGILDKTSSTFCLAKWHHTTIYLHLGETHSCYHPRPHTIPLDELKNNPSALHNTNEKKLERKKMLEGKKPIGCQYCWNVEKMGPGYISDRKQRTVAIHEGDENRLQEILDNDWDFDVNPEYIELSFGNSCNFKCGYCHPKYSSRFLDEIREFGPYKHLKNESYDIDWFIDKLYEEEDENPYVRAWFEWWPELSKTLSILRITGGEPLIHGSTYRLLDEINKNPQPNLELNINTNLGMSPKLFNRFIQKIKPIIEQKKVKSFKIFTSLDTYSREKAEYVRNGLDLDLWNKNFNTYLTEIDNSCLSLMITFNNLVVSSFDTLLEQVLEWRKEYNIRGWLNENGHPVQRIQIDTPYLKEPSHYDMNILPKEDFGKYMDKHLQFMEDNCEEWDINKYDHLEVAKFRRVHDYYMSNVITDEYRKQGWRNFFNFFSQHDLRRGTNFIATFPEYEKFWIQCKEEVGLVKLDTSADDRKLRFELRKKLLAERRAQRKNK